MDKDSLPLIFGPGKLEHLQVGPWYENLISKKNVYTNCFVPSFTRVKNLGSKYMHEYCQFIVEDRSTNEHGRLYVERMNETVVDVITLGRDEKSPRGWDELPLPLTSVSFESKEQQPSLLDVAKVISSVSVVGGKYNFYDKNCFWFAFTTFDTVRLAFPGTLKNWLWVNPGGSGGGSVGDAWGLGFPTMFKYFFKSSAKDFEKERMDHTNWLQPIDDRDQITPEDFVKKLSGHLLEPQSVAAYRKWTQTLDVDMSKEDLEHIMSSVESKIKDLDEKGGITWTEDFDGAVIDLTQKALSDPNASTYLAKYNAQPITGFVDINTGGGDINIGHFKAIDAVSGEEVAKPSNNDLVPNTDADERLVKALRVLVGAVLADAGLGKE